MIGGGHCDCHTNWDCGKRSRPSPGDTVCWQSPFDGWRVGVYVGLAPGDSGEGDPFVAVDSHNGRVHVRLSALTF